MTRTALDLDQPPLSPATRKRLEIELATLKAERDDLAEAINGSAEPVGDVADRADVLSRFEELDRVDRQVEEILTALTRPVRAAAPQTSLVEIGATVTLRHADGSPEVVVLADLLEDDGEALLVTPRSPLGQALLGRSVGEEVTFRAPAGEVRVGIEAIGAAA